MDLVRSKVSMMLAIRSHFPPPSLWSWAFLLLGAAMPDLYRLLNGLAGSTILGAFGGKRSG